MLGKQSFFYSLAGEVPVDTLCDLLRTECEHDGNRPALASKTLAVPEPLTRYFSVSGVKGIYGTKSDHDGSLRYPSHRSL